MSDWEVVTQNNINCQHSPLSIFPLESLQPIECSHIRLHDITLLASIQYLLFGTIISHLQLTLTLSGPDY